jgi:terpene synthase-like protein
VRAAETGATCAVAGQSQRAMRDWAAEYPRLYESKAFDPALFSTLALAAAFSGPGLSAAELRMANRACLWCFGLDWRVDFAAADRAEVDAMVRRCAAVGDGAVPLPGDDLTGFLAAIRDELATRPAWAGLAETWRTELRRMLGAMAREWSWKAAKERPSVAGYLDNADNLGFCFVFAAHWIHTGPVASDPGPVTAASRQVQRVIRLLNDLGTYQRDLAWGDLNILLLGPSRTEVEQTIAEHTRQARELIARIGPEHAGLARYLERQMDFCAGFYGVTDYWGSL